MSLAALLNRNLTIIRRTDSGDVNTYGDTVYDETLVEVVGELQQLRRDEPAAEGETSDTRWMLFLPAGTALSTRDVVLVDDEEYEVVGEPWQARNPRTQALSHVECSLRRTAGSGDEVGS
jgi:hypothetical protein